MDAKELMKVLLKRFDHMDTKLNCLLADKNSGKKDGSHRKGQRPPPYGAVVDPDLMYPKLMLGPSAPDDSDGGVHM